MPNIRKIPKTKPGYTIWFWTILSEEIYQKYIPISVLARCVCGREQNRFLKDIFSGKAKSCGCKKAEMCSAANLTHGKSKHLQKKINGKVSKEYQTWCSLKERCLNEKNKSYQNYGARGITVCRGWSDSFESFLLDMGERPVGTTIDRINNDGGYWCGHCDECVAAGRVKNCRWASRITQATNTRINVFLTLGDETLTISEWARRINVEPGVIWTRINRHGWSTEEALTTPNLHTNFKFTHSRFVKKGIS